ncbi:protein PYRICULARIA ORYZAE RESISTANCE 21-like isoform X2 [Zingiber officinale]|nr:protein PYRICULARIA ORYZAE RESISTANCE 21-like isoform X2 [Zingiber officinale]
MWKLVMEVDLDCHLCSKKIKRTICKLQEKVKILRISYDQKNGIVTIAGRFDPERVSKKLKDEAGKVIKSIKVEEEKEKKPKEKKEGKVADMNVPEFNLRDRIRGTFTELPGTFGESRGSNYWFCC